MAAAWLILRYAPRWNWRREDGVSFEMLSDYIGAYSEGELATSIALRHSFRNRWVVLITVRTVRRRTEAYGGVWRRTEAYGGLHTPPYGFTRLRNTDPYVIIASK